MREGGSVSVGRLQWVNLKTLKADQFKTAIDKFTANFRYHNAGIRLRDQNRPQGRVYPIIEMEWIEGMTLSDKINELCNKRDLEALRILTDQWITVLRRMHQAHIAHGHLSGDNVMVRMDGRLVLVDYDGVYIPDFRGFPSIVFGTPDYEHPLMLQRQFNKWMDSFSALVIYTALIALQIQPELWDKYPSAGNLMFVHQDFMNPAQSPLLQDLEALKNVQVMLAIQELKKACLLPIHQVRFPFHIFL